MMKLNRKYTSPNYDPVDIPVEFLVLHYTAGSLESTLDLFLDPSREVSAHLVMGENGEVYELVKCWEGSTQQAWHAGRSHWLEAGEKWEEFNHFSIGIEIVNLNGNLFPYTDEQYAGLKEVTAHLRSKYPALNSPYCVVGHEQIADWRGKVDPGFNFDWHKFYEENYRGMEHPHRNNVCHPEIAESFRGFISAAPQDPERSSQYWHAVSHAMETSNRLRQMQRE